jgi:bacteriorhodopsin
MPCRAATRNTSQLVPAPLLCSPLFTFSHLQINAIGALAYLIMALGNTSYAVFFDPEFPEISRDFQWIRYAQWAITGPLTLITFGLLAGAHWVEVLFIVLACLVGVAAGFAGALSTGLHATWPIFAFAVAAFLVIIYSLLGSFRRSAYQLHVEVGKLYDFLAYSMGALFTGYLIVWASSEGGHIADVDQEVIVYTVLDVLTKLIFGFILLFSRESIARYGKFLGGSFSDVDFAIRPQTHAYAAVPTAAYSQTVTVPYSTTVHIPEGNIPATASLQLTLNAADIKGLIVKAQ